VSLAKPVSPNSDETTAVTRSSTAVMVKIVAAAKIDPTRAFDTLVLFP
jgi:hypothetical protein